MRHAIATSVLLGLIVAHAHGQSITPITSPRHYTRAEADTWDIYPWYTGVLPIQRQQIHDDTVGTAGTISALELRSDDYTDNGTFTLFGQLVLAEAAAGVTSTNMGTSFAGNIDAATSRTYPLTLSFGGDLYQARHSPIPRLPALTLALNPPFAYSGTRPIVWWLTITGTSGITGGGGFDCVAGAAPGGSVYTQSIGQGCPATQLGPDAANGTGVALDWTTGALTLDFLAFNQAPNQPGFFTLGSSKTSFGGAPLPLLVPGTPRCYLHSSIADLYGAAANGSGLMARRQFMGTFVQPQALNGVTLFVQAVGYAPTANAAGWITTEAREFHLVAPTTQPPPVAMLDQNGSGVPTLQPGHGYVVRFR